MLQMPQGKQMTQQTVVYLQWKYYNQMSDDVKYVKDTSSLFECKRMQAKLTKRKCNNCLKQIPPLNKYYGSNVIRI